MIFGRNKKNTTPEEPTVAESTAALEEISAPVVELDPGPDQSTKPKDIVGFCFSFACSSKHVVGGDIESIDIDKLKERRTCQKCGKITKIAIVKRTAEALWLKTYSYNGWNIPKIYSWEWRQHFKTYDNFGGGPLWTKKEFVGFVGAEKARKR